MLNKFFFEYSDIGVIKKLFESGLVGSLGERNWKQNRKVTGFDS